MQEGGDRALSSILEEKGITNPNEGFTVEIDKIRHTLTLLHKGMQLKTYRIDIGGGGIEDKEAEGDRKTPEGMFHVTDKRVINPPDVYLGSRWLGINYPNEAHAGRGLTRGLINKQTYDAIINAVYNGHCAPQNTPLGGEIGIHGGCTQEHGSDWTWGCIALSNSDIEEFYNYVDNGTAVIIRGGPTGTGICSEGSEADESNGCDVERNSPNSLQNPGNA